MTHTDFIDIANVGLSLKELVDMVNEAKRCYKRYVEVTEKINKYLTENFNVRITYHYSGTEFPRSNLDFYGVRAIYGVPVEYNGRSGTLYVLENGDVIFFTCEIYPGGKDKLKVEVTVKKLLGKVG